jgi:hypothetical protein
LANLDVESSFVFDDGSIFARRLGRDDWDGKVKGCAFACKPVSGVKEQDVSVTYWRDRELSIGPFIEKYLSAHTPHTLGRLGLCFFRNDALKGLLFEDQTPAHVVASPMQPDKHPETDHDHCHLNGCLSKSHRNILAQRVQSIVHAVKFGSDIT